MRYATSTAFGLLTALALVFGAPLDVRAQQISETMQTAINNNDSALLAVAIKEASPDVASAIVAAMAKSGKTELMSAVFTSLAQSGVTQANLQALANVALAANPNIGNTIASAVTAGGGTVAITTTDLGVVTSIVVVTLPNPTQTAQNNTCANQGSCS